MKTKESFVLCLSLTHQSFTKPKNHDSLNRYSKPGSDPVDLSPEEIQVRTVFEEYIDHPDSSEDFFKVI